MKNNTFLVFLLLLTHLTFGQIPSGYYDSATNLTGEELKVALYNIIKGHTEYTYTSTSTDVWDILKESDRDPNNSENVILFYTGWSVNAAQEYNNGSGWSREHVWAKSRGDFGTSNGPGTDCHHLRPADISVNSARNNRWFNYCSEPYLDGGVETGCFTSSTDWFWQPRDEVKGDVARMIFYMATRYEGENGEPDLEVIDSIPSDQYTNAPVHAKLDALLAWNTEDPVDDFERNRNEVVFSYQGNRNPFVDHPEYVELIWNNSNVGLNTLEELNIKVYPNPCEDKVYIESNKQWKVEIYTISGEMILYEIATEEINISSFDSGTYLLMLKNDQGEIQYSDKLIKL